jgi:hypothetical protein
VPGTTLALPGRLAAKTCLAAPVDHRRSAKMACGQYKCLVIRGTDHAAANRPKDRRVAAQQGSRQVSFLARNALFSERSPLFIEQRFRARMLGLTLQTRDERILSGERCGEHAVSGLPAFKPAGF